MIPGAGWVSVGPGYQHWYGKDSLFVDASAAISVNNYRMAPGPRRAAEVPQEPPGARRAGALAGFRPRRLLRRRPATRPKTRCRSTAIESTQLTAYATLRPFRWMDIGGQIGWMNPDVTLRRGPVAARTRRAADVRAERSVADDRHARLSRVIRPAASCCAASAPATTIAPAARNTFNRYEGEAAGFLPIAGGRVVLGAAWLAWSAPNARSGGTVPFYLQPSLGGVNTLRRITDYRFHDDNMLLANAEVAAGADDAPRSRGVRRCRQRRGRAGDLDLDQAILRRRVAPAHAPRDLRDGRRGARATKAGACLFRLKDPLAPGAPQQEERRSCRSCRSEENDDDPCITCFAIVALTATARRPRAPA